MRIKLLFQISLTALILVFFFSTLNAFAEIKVRKPGLKITPHIQKNMKSANRDFQKCKKEALKELNSKKITQTEFKKELEECRENYPAGALNSSCKKEALELKNPKQIKVKLKECKRILAAASFSDQDPTPFVVYEDKLYFNGVDMNVTREENSLNLQNFNCDSIINKSDDAEDAVYYIFGNQPEHFIPEERSHTFRKLTESAPPDEEGQVYLEDFGLIVNPTKKKNSEILYFPTGGCSFSGKLNSNLVDQSIYFLLDKKNHKYTPLFGIVFYNNDSKEINQALNSGTLTNRVKKTLGPEYKLTKSKAEYIFISSVPMTQFDKQNGPKNLCKSPRKNKYLGVIKKTKGPTPMPEYLLIANIENLCAYGDEIFHRL